MGERDDRRAAGLVAGAPPAAMLLVRLFAAEGAAGLFQTDLAALVVAAGVSAFAMRARLLSFAAILLAAVLSALIHALLGGSLGGAPAVGLLVLASGVAASGLAAIGRGLGAPWLTAGSLGAAVLWVAMTGLLWADPMAERLPRERRYVFKQAVLHLDLATACAYDGASFDRFHDEVIYREVPLASSIVRAPAAGPTGAVWLIAGLLAWGVAWLLGAARKRA